MNLAKKHIKILILSIIIPSIFFAIFILTVIGGTYEEYIGVLSTYENSQEEFLGEGEDEIQAGIVKGKRTSYPSRDNPFFFSSKYNPFVGTPNGPPALTHNCTWYAYGRFAEILGRKPVGLPVGNADQWYPSCTAFKKGRTPKLGAIICWRYIGVSYGHVAVVEEIKPNGDIVTSNSGYRGGKFWLQTWTKKSGYQGGIYVLQGFIYQPKEPDFTPSGTEISSSGVNGNKIANTAINLAWSAGTPKSKYSYKGGSATSMFKSTFNKMYPNHTRWGAGSKTGASCDVFVGTVVRSTGYDTKYPRGFQEQLPHVQKSSKWKRVKGFDENNRSVSMLKNGDVIFYKRTTGSVHTLIYYNKNGSEGRIEAGYRLTYGHVAPGRASLQKKLNAKNIYKLYAYRPN